MLSPAGPRTGSTKDVSTKQVFIRWAQPFPRTRRRPERRPYCTVKGPITPLENFLYIPKPFLLCCVVSRNNHEKPAISTLLVGGNDGPSGTGDRAGRTA